MGVSILKTAFALQREIGNKLSVRYGALATPLAVALSADSSGNPTISIGAGSPGGQNLFIRIIEFPSLGVDSVGGSQVSYGPHKIQLAMETSGTTGVPVTTSANQFPALLELFRHGAMLELYLDTNGNNPSASSLVVANLVGLYDELRNPFTASL